MGEETSKRLAVQNLDWEQITAKDLFAIFSSLSKEENTIEKVEIYTSEYGKKMLSHDTLYGPQGVWKASEPEPEKSSDEVPKETKERLVQKNEYSNKEFDPVALRKYELQKLRYFYGVVYCKTLEIAERIYNEYDGFEYEQSSFKFDLRFIPDSLNLPEPPKEVCDKVEPGFQPKLNIINTAVQQSKVQLTWEAPNAKRYEMITKKISPDKLEEMDLKDYLGSESEESNEEGENKEKDKYKRLLFEGKEEKEKGDDNLIISFKGGLEEEIEDTGKEEWNEEKYQEKEKKKGKKNKNKRIEEEKLPDDTLNLLIDKKNKEGEFKLNVEDPRFDALYKDKRYLIDPSSKDFKKASKDVIKEQIKRKKVDN